mgnify:FL=1
MKTKIVFDCETGDPDDMLTLLMLCDHPRVDLQAVTVTPGSKAQIGLVRHLLRLMGKDVPVGAFNIDHPKECVSAWHYTAFGTIDPSEEAEEGWQVLLNNCGPDVTLLTGAALKNLGARLKWADTAAEDEPRWRFERWVAQGGFAGEGVVPSLYQLEKFKGLRTCPTYNFNGDPKAALAALKVKDRFGERLLVSKNVCHGVKMGADLLARTRAAAESTKRRSLELVAQHCPDGKALHDPLAMTCAIDQAVGTWSYPITMFREKGEWGCIEAAPTKSDTRITINYERSVFENVLLEG